MKAEAILFGFGVLLILSSEFVASQAPIDDLPTVTPDELDCITEQATNRAQDLLQGCSGVDFASLDTDLSPLCRAPLCVDVLNDIYRACGRADVAEVIDSACGRDATATIPPATLPTPSPDQQACIAEGVTEQFSDILSDCGQDLLTQLETNPTAFCDNDACYNRFDSIFSSCGNGLIPLVCGRTPSTPGDTSGSSVGTAIGVSVGVLVVLVVIVVTLVVVVCLVKRYRKPSTSPSVATHNQQYPNTPSTQPPSNQPYGKLYNDPEPAAYYGNPANQQYEKSDLTTTAFEAVAPPPSAPPLYQVEMGLVPESNVTDSLTPL